MQRENKMNNLKMIMQKKVVKMILSNIYHLLKGLFFYISLNNINTINNNTIT